MRSFLIAGLLALALPACSKSSSGSAEQKAASIPTVTVNELDTMLASNQCQAVDANGEGTRKKMGVIPGAVLLPDGATTDLKGLPADKAKPLVFYCANTHCGASHEAAEQARTAGYQNVKVLPDGIAGWVQAGKKVSQI